MTHICKKCGMETEEPNDKFCYLCIATRAFQMYRRAYSFDAIYNWYWAIGELSYEAKMYQW